MQTDDMPALVHEQIRAALEALPAWSSNEIALALFEQGVKAECGKPERCALAVYLTNEVPLPDGWGIQVGGIWVAATTRDADGGGFTIKCWVPYSTLENGREIKAFIQAFDNHLYPALVA